MKRPLFFKKHFCVHFFSSKFITALAFNSFTSLDLFKQVDSLLGPASNVWDILQVYFIAPRPPLRLYWLEEVEGKAHVLTFYRSISKVALSVNDVKCFQLCASRGRSPSSRLNAPKRARFSGFETVTSSSLSSFCPCGSSTTQTGLFQDYLLFPPSSHLSPAKHPASPHPRGKLGPFCFLGAIETDGGFVISPGEKQKPSPVSLRVHHWSAHEIQECDGKQTKPYPAVPWTDDGLMCCF